MAQAYGVLPEGKEYCSRHTVYIGKDGSILLIDREVKPMTAGQDVAARLAELGVSRKP